MTKKVTRLASQFAPQNYKVHLTISDDKLSFTGSAKISGRKIGRPSNRITFHQRALKIDAVKVVGLDKKQGGTDLKPARVVAHQKLEELRLHFDETIYPGDFEIEITYSGHITRNMDGVYPCFFEHDGKKKQLIATQFESHHARDAFPCIDEPEAKATFDLTLTHAADELSLSNTLPVSEEDKDGKKTTVFAQTPLMSTYLLAFVIGELKSKEASSKSGVHIRTFATPDQIEHTGFALDVAVKCMDFYEGYYDIPFPLEKCDFVALPDFASGAMENWGLITFREQALLFDPANTSKSTKQWVALVVAHELTHQWFGNLVTMRWWTDLWLNEGFASWMEYLAIDKIFPEWQLWTQFVVDEQQLALKLDALEHTHPIEVPVGHPDEIRTIFDAISYQKGASVLHMLHDYMGPEGFRDGVRHYLKKHSYGNTDTVDLWQALEDTSGKPVKQFMSAWTTNAGFPLLRVEHNNNYLSISQKRFVSNPLSAVRDDKSLWPIPLLNPGLPKPTVQKSTENIPLDGSDLPLKLNLNQTGFYRVDYSLEIQDAQLKALENDKFSPIDRMGLLSDGFEITKAGYQPVNEYLDLLEHYADDDSLSVWEIITASVGAIRNTLSKSDDDNELRDILKPFLRNLTTKQYDRLGWDERQGEPHLDTLLRPLIIGAAASADEPKILSLINDAWQAKTNDHGQLNPDLRAIVYATKARLGTDTEYEQMLKMYRQTTSSDEKLSLTSAMTSFEQPELHHKVLELIKTDTVRLQDISYWIAYMFTNRHARSKTWEWLKTNWQWLKENNGTDLSFSRMPIYAARNFSDESHLLEYIEFFKQNMEPMLERTYKQGLEIIETNVEWRKRDAQAALDWFKARDY